MVELHSAIAGLSDVYILADHANGCVVRMDAKDKGKARLRERKLSVKDVFKQKDVLRPVVESAGIDAIEFRPLEMDIITYLISGYSEENASALKN